MASGFIYNCDRKRYQSRIDHMNANYSLTHLPYGQRNQYPMTVENVSTLLNRHRADNQGTRNTGSNKSKNQGANNNETEADGTNLAQTGETITGQDALYAGIRHTRHRTVLRRPDLQANGSDLTSIGTIRLYRQVWKEDSKDKATHRLVWTSFLLRVATMGVEWEGRLGPSYLHNDQADGT